MKNLFKSLCLLLSISSLIAIGQPINQQQKLERMLRTALVDNDPIATLTILKVFQELEMPVPKVNLCRVGLENLDLYCKQNIGIGRINMPQFIGAPRARSLAQQLPKKRGGRVDGSEQFKKFLLSRGYTLTAKRVPSHKLKATQNELIGSKIAGIWWMLKENPNHPMLKSPIFISSDNYVLDGHHRWASLTGADIEDGQLGDVQINALQINVPIKQLVKLANEFVDSFGIMPESGVGK